MDIDRFQWALSVSLTIWNPAPPQPYEILTPTSTGQSHGSMALAEWGAQNFEERGSGFWCLSNPSAALLKSYFFAKIHSVITTQLHTDLSLHVFGCGRGCSRRRIKVFNQLSHWRMKEERLSSEKTTLKCSGERAGFHLQLHKGFLWLFYKSLSWHRNFHKECMHEQYVSSNNTKIMSVFGLTQQISRFTTKATGVCLKAYKERR